MPEKSEQQWTSCEGGEISSMVSRIKQIRRKTAIQKAVTASVCVLALITVGTVYWNNQHAQTPLSHQVALSLLPDYQAGRLDADTSARMEAHLAHCEACRLKLKQLKGEESLLGPNQSNQTIGQISNVVPDWLLAFAR